MALKLSNSSKLEQLALKELNHRRKLNSWHFHCNLVCHNHLHCSNKSCVPRVRRPTGDRRQLPYKRCVNSRCWANDQVPTKILQRVDTRRFQLKRDRSAGQCCGCCHCDIYDINVVCSLVVKTNSAETKTKTVALETKTKNVNMKKVHIVQPNIYFKPWKNVVTNKSA